MAIDKTKSVETSEKSIRFYSQWGKLEFYRTVERTVAVGLNDQSIELDEVDIDYLMEWLAYNLGEVGKTSRFTDWPRLRKSDD